MLFKRPQVRYSETPTPVTPYQAAAQVWGSAYRQRPRASEELAADGLRLSVAGIADGG